MVFNQRRSEDGAISLGMNIRGLMEGDKGE